MHVSLEYGLMVFNFELNNALPDHSLLMRERKHELTKK